VKEAKIVNTDLDEETRQFKRVKLIKMKGSEAIIYPAKMMSKEDEWEEG